MNLHEDGVLVALRRSVRGISARSKTVTKESAEAHDANQERVKGTILKLSPADLAPLYRIINAAQSLFLDNTLPWDGDRHLIPVTRYAYLKKEIEKLINEFDDEVENLLKRYPALKRAYLKDVNDLAQEVPFPTLEQMRGNFSLRFDMTQIPNVDDFRLNHVDPKTAQRMKAEIEAATAERMGEAHKDIINRLYKVVARVHEATSKEEGRLFETLVSNIEEAVDVLPKLNMTNDPQITRLISRVRTELSSIDVQTLRTNPAERAKTSKLAGSILNDLRSYGKPSKRGNGASQPTPKKVTAPSIATPTVRKRNPFAGVSV